MSQLSVAHLNKSYGEHPVLRDVSLEVASGEFLTIVGPSGCGKSTLLRIVAGLEPADSGAVRFNGEPVDHLPPKDRDVAMVFQSYALYPHKTVGENIAMPLRMRRLSFLARAPFARFASRGIAARYRAIDADVQDTAAMVGLDALLARRPAQLSGGQRQRVAIARAIVRKARLTLMDEPFSSLDANLRVQLRGDVASLHKALGNTILFVTHDAAEAMTLSDRVAVMADGQILETGPPQGLYDNPGHLVVARLLGQAALNTLPGSWQGTRLGFSGVSLPTTTARSGASDVTVAFRPEAARLCERLDSARAIPATVERVASLGSDLFVHLRSIQGDRAITVRCPPQSMASVSPGACVGVEIAVDRLLVFGHEGERLRNCVFGREAERVS